MAQRCPPNQSLSEMRRRDYIRRLVDQAPPLSDRTRAELRELLKPSWEPVPALT